MEPANGSHKVQHIREDVGNPDAASAAKRPRGVPLFVKVLEAVAPTVEEFIENRILKPEDRELYNSFTKDSESLTAAAIRQRCQAILQRIFPAAPECDYETFATAAEQQLQHKIAQLKEAFAAYDFEGKKGRPAHFPKIKSEGWHSEHDVLNAVREFVNESPFIAEKVKDALEGALIKRVRAQKWDDGNSLHTLKLILAGAEALAPIFPTLKTEFLNSFQQSISSQLNQNKVFENPDLMEGLGSLCQVCKESQIPISVDPAAIQRIRELYSITGLDPQMTEACEELLSCLDPAFSPVKPTVMLFADGQTLTLNAPEYALLRQHCKFFDTPSPEFQVATVSIPQGNPESFKNFIAHLQGSFYPKTLEEFLTLFKIADFLLYSKSYLLMTILSFPSASHEFVAQIQTLTQLFAEHPAVEEMCLLQRDWCISRHFMALMQREEDPLPLCSALEEFNASCAETRMRFKKLDLFSLLPSCLRLTQALPSLQILELHKTFPAKLTEIASLVSHVKELIIPSRHYIPNPPPQGLIVRFRSPSNFI